MSYFWRLLFSIIILLVLSFSTLFQSTFASTEVMQNQRLEGYALKQPLNVYDSPNREATVLKNYSYNHKLVFILFLPIGIELLFI